MPPIQQDIFKFLDLQLVGISLGSWIAALLAFLIVLVILVVVRRALIRRLSHTAAHTHYQADDIALDLLKYTRPYFMFGLALYVGSLFLTLSDQLTSFIHILLIVLVLLQAAVWGSRLIAIFVSRAITRRGEPDLENSAAINLLGLMARVILWVVIFLLILSNIPGFNVSALVASLGITGIAVAFALQKVLADLFASFSIALDKPFVVGDYILVGDQQGIVERVGLKSTRIRNLTGEQLIISNSDLLASRIHNFQRMQERRVAFDLKISPKTPFIQLTRLPDILKSLIDGQPQVAFDQVTFQEIGDNAYRYQVVYRVLSPDYRLYVQIQQAINLAIVETFSHENILFSFQ